MVPVAPPIRITGRCPASWKRLSTMNGIKWPICILSPVGSTPQYSETALLFVSSRSPSASVCWLMASRHSSSSIIFNMYSPFLIKLWFVGFYALRRQSAITGILRVSTKKIAPCLYRHRDDWINRVTTQIARTACTQAIVRTTFQRVIVRLAPLGITQDTPECNSQPSCVPGSITPRLSVTGTRLLLRSFNVYQL
ncbi:hypothetical protein D3C73_995850 [compost metagenome]